MNALGNLVLVATFAGAVAFIIVLYELEKFMSAVSEFAATQSAALATVSTKLDAVKTRLDALEAAAGSLSPEDQAALAQITTDAQAVVDKVSAIVP